MYFDIENKRYNINIIRKNNKNLYIRVDENLNINITSPFLYSDLKIKKILDENINSIVRMINQQENKRQNKLKEEHMFLGNNIEITYLDVKKPVFKDYKLTVKDKTMLGKWYKEKAKEVFLNYLDEAYDFFIENIPYPKLKIRSMKTRWGVANKRDNSVTLNLELIKKDPKYLNYVIIHELSHFVYFDHSKNFWKIVEKYCPNYKIIRKELNEK